jgi:SAM-dependent methyltransferase
MAPMTDDQRSRDVSQFYDRLAGGYDSMIGFQGRFAKDRPFFHHLVNTQSIRTAIDAGAGTGFHSLLLAQLGVEVTAVDISPRMLEALSKHAAEMGLSVKTLAADLAGLPDQISSPVDAVFSLGNTLAHCLSHNSLTTVLGGFRKVLRPGGLLFVQLLNYRRILVSREEILNIKEADGFRFTRRYEYGKELIRFTITREDLNGNAPPEVEAVELFPHVDSNVEAALRVAGVGQIQMFGSIEMGLYDPMRSKDLVVMAYTQ